MFRERRGKYTIEVARFGREVDDQIVSVLYDSYFYTDSCLYGIYESIDEIAERLKVFGFKMLSRFDGS